MATKVVVPKNLSPDDFAIDPVAKRIKLRVSPDQGNALSHTAKGLYVSPAGGSVDLPPGNANGDVLVWNSSTQNWKPQQPSGDLPAGATSGQVLTWDDTSQTWLPQAIPSQLPAGGTEGEVLTWDDVLGGYVPEALGDAARKNTGTTAGTVAAGDDSRIENAIQKPESPQEGQVLTVESGEWTAKTLPPVEWGDISGDITDQTDLRQVLASKLDASALNDINNKVDKSGDQMSGNLAFQVPNNQSIGFMFSSEKNSYGFGVEVFTDAVGNMTNAYIGYADSGISINPNGNVWIDGSVGAGGGFNGTVPNTRKVNNKQLNADITLDASDVDAEPAFTKNTAFNRDFGTTAGTVAAGDHTHSITNVTGLQTALDSKLPTTDASVTNAREWTAAAVSQAEAETGTSTTARKWSALRVRQAVAAWWGTIGTTFGKSLLGAADAAAGRTALGLGTAATADVTTSTVDTTVGAILKRGDYGLGVTTGLCPSIADLMPSDAATGLPTGFFQFPSTAVNSPTGAMGMGLIAKYLGRWTSTLFIPRGDDVINRGSIFIAHSTAVSSYTPWYKIYSSGNTTVDSNGFIKQASPIINLYADRADKNDSLEIAPVDFERVETGVYLLTSCPPLSSDGWYLEQPRDRNGQVYHNVEWYYDETTKALRIETYKRVWNTATGEYENGEPVDIQSGRFISLRFAEDSSLYPEPEQETEVSNEG